MIKIEEMTQITIQINDKEEENFVETFLKKMNISFERNDGVEEDFEFTEEMKRVVDERRAKNHTKLTPAKEFLAKIRKDYEL